MIGKEYRVTYSDLLRFFLPVAAMTMIMMSSHNVISAALAQMAAPAIALTAYSVGQNISTMIQAPIWALVKLTTATATNRESIRNLMKVAWQTAVIVFIMMLVVAFTPMSKVIFVNLMGISEDILPATLTAFRVFLIMPFFGVIRSAYQGFISLSRKTIWLTVATVLRISSMFLVALFLTKTKLLTGGIVGSVILIVGFCTEAVVAYIKGRSWLKDVAEKAVEGDEVQSVSHIWVFFFPLVVAQIVNSFVNPGISAGLARTVNPEVAISSYYIARSLAWIFLGMSFRVHQLVLVFVKDQNSWLVVRRFVYGLAIFMVLCLGILSFTPLGAWLYANIINVEDVLAKEALKALSFFMVLPPLMFIAELYQGIMLKQRRSREISVCKVANLITLFTVLFVLVTLYPQMGSKIGAISMVASYLVEAIVAYYLSRKYDMNRMKTLTSVG